MNSKLHNIMCEAKTIWTSNFTNSIVIYVMSPGTKYSTSTLFRLTSVQ